MSTRQSTKAPSARTQVKRQPDRADYTTPSIHAYLDAVLIGHVGFNDPTLGHVAVIPTFISRVGNDLLFHTLRISRLAEAARKAEICVSATIEDGLVLAKSAFHHSMNYRSIVAFGRAREILEPQAKLDAMRAFTDKLIPGRYDRVRAPSDKELAMTAIFALSLDEASAKSRSGGPKDDPEDLRLPVETGVVPIAHSFGTLIPDEPS
jgi:nitroimidazol reductase NimA-like FMN-containing flavoprotein (pyridoxamine 5'-phosphate oxidase superfamily)